jgi:hypothetical protein
MSAAYFLQVPLHQPVPCGTAVPSAEQLASNAEPARRTRDEYVLFYESADDVLEKAPLHFAAHSERGQEFHARGNPFVLRGVVRRWHIREWNESFLP